jgi:hypothetical protein
MLRTVISFPWNEDRLCTGDWLFSSARDCGWASDLVWFPIMSTSLGCHICVTCGTQFSETEAAPPECPICLDERQYVGSDGQQWTTLDAMRRGDWKNVIREQEPNLIGIGTEPKFAIGERALLVRAPGGNILWDCISFLDAATIEAVRKLGGISAIAISHPHYYSLDGGVEPRIW